MLSKGNAGAGSWDIDVESALTGDFCININATRKFGTYQNFWNALNRYGQWQTFFIVHTANGVDTGTENWRFYINGVSSDNWKLASPAGRLSFEGNTEKLSLGNYSNGTSPQKCNGIFDDFGIFGVDVTRGTDEGAKAFYQLITGPGSSSFNP